MSEAPDALPADWAPLLARDLAELIAAATALTQLVGAPDDVTADFAAELSRLSVGGSGQ